MILLPSSSLIKPGNKYIKLYKDDFIIVEGPLTKGKLSMGDIKIPYEQYFYTEILLDANTFHQEIPYGALGSQITFLAIKVSYIPVVKTATCTDVNTSLEYFFQTNENEIRNINGLLILTGTEDKKIPRIFLNNPSLDYRAKVEILASTTSIIYGDGVSTNVINDTTFDIQDLMYTNIVSDGISIIVQLDADTPIANMAISRISNIEISGRLLIVDDTATGKVNLFFINEFHCLQAYSLMNWTISDPTHNIITESTGPDLISPVITYKSSFTTEISLLDYEQGSSGTYLITKQDLITLLIDNALDNRDGNIYIDQSNITLSKVNQSIKIESISEIGKYSFMIDVVDSAGNITSDSFVLNITDNTPPVVTITSLGYELYQNSLNSTGGTSGFASQTSIYLQDYSFDTIDKQDLLSMLVSSVIDMADGNTILNTNNVEVTITNFNDVTIIEEITASGYYDVYFQVVDTNNNASSSLWYNGVELLNSSDSIFTNLSIQIKTNVAPVVNFLPSIPSMSLMLYGGIITKNIIKNAIIDNIVDDRDGVITANILNISLFQTHYWDVSTSGTSGNSIVVVDGSDTYVFEPMTETEVIYAMNEGIYLVGVLVTDSDGALTLQEVSVNIIT